MQKTDLIKTAAERAGVSQKDAAAVINATLEAITAALARGEKVTITGFGTFEVRERQAREGVNPQTREKIQIAARKLPGFTAGVELKRAIPASE